MRAIVASYIAGLIDGEGCFSITKRVCEKGRPSRHNQFACELTVGMTVKTPIAFLYQQFGGTFRNYPKPPWKRVFVWRVAGKRAKEIAKLLLPYLKVKKEQAKLLIKFQEHHAANQMSRWNKPASNKETAWRTKAWKRMSKLNS